ncbi:MAG TPA: sigma-54 dependent transcriptional regulator [Anaeromyxobacteraceae bacterium]|nr:sigma-54 dependent transcriptional regulator [Anaeromyxobacteraceae bacterium]
MDWTVSAPSTEESRTNLVHASNSPIVDVVRACERIAQSDATVLITGETGTGKEVFARLLHEKSRRSARPLVPVNCGAIPESLLESELFGHVRGAFTGATSARRGRVAAAEGGTLFLDEIGELSLALQVKLLRVLQERVYEPVGSAESVPANFRLIAATNRDLAAEVEAGRFRRDLYYRLLVCPVDLPPLRERPQDIGPLFGHFWKQRGEGKAVDPAVLRLLESHDWPGNVRELENLVERLAVCTEGSVIRIADLPAHLRPARVCPPPAYPPPPAAPPAESVPSAEERAFEPSPARPDELPPLALPTPIFRVLPGGAEVPTPQLPAFDGQAIDLPTMLRRLEQAYIDAALAHTQGNKKAAADLLGLQRTTLVEKLRRRTREATVC